ncbi:HD domain-containing phosphohydrolase [Chitinilyticum litopenaei]|uniref:HD domain-containing phosphohydrolase n=1 Tax=Chitinilyticum litopenaei TaxID=1121276 RepID=UPI0003F83A85|nr:HD domain-containing phosphohydrolase [Chitinilyticum litopenaei]
MTDLSLTEPVIQDPESFQDFREALADYAPRIEQLLAELRQQPANTVLIADLFRCFHNIKGDAGLCQVHFVIPLVHSVETLLTRVRAGELRCSELLGEILLLTLDRLEQAVENLAAKRPLAQLQLLELQLGLEALGEESSAALDVAAARLIEAVTGFKPATVQLPQRLGLQAQLPPGAAQEDLHFFHSLALQLENQSPLFQGRTARNLKLALDTNHAAGTPVDPVQLEAAVYLHDVGMMLLPADCWLDNGVLNAEQHEHMHLHPGWAAGLLARMPGWSLAAEICLQHHERPDGSGYPNGLQLAQIHHGARILALVDAFEAVMLKHSHRGQQRSVLRAISEINATEQQFDAFWVEPFNRIIRTMLEASASAPGSARS